MDQAVNLLRTSIVATLITLGAGWGLQSVAANEQARTVTVQPSNASNLWSKPSDDVLKKTLTQEQYAVTQHEATERPFKNAYWDNKDAGIYVDIASGEPLFSSKDKFKSGTGWPSFTRPLVSKHVTEKADWSIFGKRTEVRSKNAGSHLGHLFADGPLPTGLRYCINSAALRFVPKDDLEKEGYSQFAQSFSQ